MLERGLYPNETIYTTLINGHCKQGNCVYYMELFDRMVENGYEPQLSLYNYVIPRLCKEGKVQEAERLFDNALQS